MLCSDYNGDLFCLLKCIFFFSLFLHLGIVFALVDLSIDTFQKENNLKTTESYALSLTYDISSCLIVVFISYYGGRGNIPRWITVSSFLIGFGSLLCAFPYFSGGNNQMNVQIEGKTIKDTVIHQIIIHLNHWLLEFKIDCDICLYIHPSVSIYMTKFIKLINY